MSPVHKHDFEEIIAAAVRPAASERARALEERKLAKAIQKREKARALAEKEQAYRARVGGRVRAWPG